MKLADCEAGPGERERRPRTPSRLIRVVQELSLARDVDAIMRIVREAARELTGADGASFVLREGELCYYADENAIAPLWKGRRFPLSACISGWVMLHRRPAVIEDVYADPRIPHDVYAATFVNSLAMVPIRRRAPLGAIGYYWRRRHHATATELGLLQALADSTAVALENVEVYAELESRVRQRTRDLENANSELAAKHEALIERQHKREALNALVVHDLKSPASAIMLAAAIRLEGRTPDDPTYRTWSRVRSSAEQIHRTALNLLDVTAIENGKLVLHPTDVDLWTLFVEVSELLGPQAERGDRSIEVDVDLPRRVVRADAELLRRVLQNLVDNAIRHSHGRGAVRLEARTGASGIEVAVSDDGAGIPPDVRARIFDPRPWWENGKDGTGGSNGLGLTFCRLAIEAHGGSLRLEENVPHGSRFCFSLPLVAADINHAHCTHHMMRR